jgi:hypothetical protein
MENKFITSKGRANIKIQKLQLVSVQKIGTIRTQQWVLESDCKNEHKFECQQNAQF